MSDLLTLYKASGICINVLTIVDGYTIPSPTNNASIKKKKATA